MFSKKTLLVLASAALSLGLCVNAQALSFKHVMNIGSQGDGDGQFKYVEDFALDSKGRLLVTDAAHAYEYPAAAYMMMGLNGLFAVMAAVGGGIYIFVTVMTVLFGKRLDTAETQPLTFPLHAGGAEAVSSYGSHKHPKLPGTVILVGIFFAAFVLYYFVNWKYLSDLWLLR